MGLLPLKDRPILSNFHAKGVCWPRSQALGSSQFNVGMRIITNWPLWHYRQHDIVFVWHTDLSLQFMGRSIPVLTPSTVLSACPVYSESNAYQPFEKTGSRYSTLVMILIAACFLVNDFQLVRKCISNKYSSVCSLWLGLVFLLYCLYLLEAISGKVYRLHDSCMMQQVL